LITVRADANLAIKNSQLIATALADGDACGINAGVPVTSNGTISVSNLSANVTSSGGAHGLFADGYAATVDSSIFKLNSANPEALYVSNLKMYYSRFVSDTPVSYVITPSSTLIAYSQLPADRNNNLAGAKLIHDIDASGNPIPNQ
jgi:hypothetical protein